MAWTVEYGKDGSFGVSGNSPGPETDAAYDRQQKINSYLGGRVFAAYADAEEDLDGICEGLAARGFVPTAALLDKNALANLERQIDEEALWATTTAMQKSSNLLATPFGFVRWTEARCLDEVLPPVEAVEFN